MAGALEQSGFNVRFEWGLQGTKTVAAGSSVVIVVDVLSFSTAVDVAVSRGAFVYPFPWNDERADEFAKQVGAVVAVDRHAMSLANPFSLSPGSLATLSRGTRIVMPSADGGTLSLVASELGATVITGCLRNATAVARAARSHLAKGSPDAIITVLAAGERWPDGSLRPALEDFLGAGAIISALADLRLSPEARAAAAPYERYAEDEVRECASARDLRADGFEQDVELALRADVSAAVPELRDGAFGPFA
jgi:2-phosphosulfolactate phosphatase